MELRVWKMCNESCTFEPTTHRICMNGIQRMKYMSEVRKRVLMQMKKTEILGNYVTVAHYMLYQKYYAFKKNLTDVTETIIENFLKSINVQKFICMFREHWYRSI